MSETPKKAADGDGDPQKRRRISSVGSEIAAQIMMGGSSPPRFLTLEEFSMASKQLENMALAHEVAVNTDFKIEAPPLPEGSLAATVKDIAHQAFWDLLTERLAADPADFSHAIILLEEIKEKLLQLLLPQHTRLKQMIEENLDIDLARQLAQNSPDALDFRPYSVYILEVMTKICAPIRDAKVAELKEITEIVPLFKGIFDMLDLMHLDMANFHLDLIKPQLKSNSVEYEREKFQKYLETSKTDLVITKTWLLESLKRLNSEHAAAPIQSESKSQKCQHTLATVLSRAFVDLLESESNLLPETLAMDAKRISELSTKYLRIILVASVWAVTCNVLGRVAAEYTAFKDQLPAKFTTILVDTKPGEDLSATMACLAEQSLHLYDQFRTSTAAGNHQPWPEVSQDQAAVLRRQTTDLAQSENRVRRVMRDRVFSFVESVIHNPNASPVKIPSGLSCVQRDIAGLTGAYLKLTSYNRLVFGPFYDEILSKLPLNCSNPERTTTSNNAVDLEQQTVVPTDKQRETCDSDGKNADSESKTTR